MAAEPGHETPYGSPTNAQLSPTCSSKHKAAKALDIILPDGAIRLVEVDYKAIGQECLDKICNSLGILEEFDYFGLTFLGAKQEELWVNMRNRLCKQLPKDACRMHLRVKFYVQPHMILQEETRHLFFLDVRNQLIEFGNWLDELKENARHHAELIALLTQAEFGDFDANRIPIKYQKFWHDGDIPAEMIALTADCHRRLLGMSAAKAEYGVLQLAAGLQMYGCVYHEAKDCFETKHCIAVGPSAICLCRENKSVIERYAYPRVQKVTINDRVLYLSLSQENGSVKELGYRLLSPRAANGLYRCVTETHSFFRCDTVRADVLEQTARDIKGALVSFFIEHDNVACKEFVFDIQRTAKEVHDAARRRLFKCSSAANSPTSLSATFSFDSADCQQQLTEEPLEAGNSAAESARGLGEHREAVGTNDEIASLRQKLESLEQSQVCRICMDRGIDVVFIPCGHMVSCRQCAEQMQLCAVCRLLIDIKQPCFAPWNA